MSSVRFALYNRDFLDLLRFRANIYQA